jgi:Xaa-Pro aminopeptidase
VSRLARLRAELARRGLDGYLVPRADEHLGEYVPASAERLAWLTGFTGSAGSAIVLASRAAVFTDGRYTLQLAAQTDAADWQRLHSIETPPPQWLAAAAPGACIGYDPWLIGEEALARFTALGLVMQPLADNPIDAIWTDRPPPPMAPALPHPLAYAGRAAAEKCAALAEGLRAAGQAAAVLSDPASIAWLLNLRGADLPFTPVALGFALLHADARVDLFMAGEKLPAETRQWLGNTVAVHEPAALAPVLAGFAGKRVRVDPAGTPAWFAETLRAGGAEVVGDADPCLLAKACKNPVEQAGARAAHLRDAAALCRFLAWLATPAARVGEVAAAAYLLACRQAVAGFRGESFPAISGAGPNGAIIHYHARPGHDREIGDNELYLIDSGGQYADGTTDVTRTVWTGPAPPPAALRDRYTRVLQGHIALARLIFPQGVAGPHIDAIARAALWQAGLDYDHGTGHGVGSFLSVHEGPAGISRAARPVPLAAGMILSNEPGYYLPGAYGIRLENLLLVQPAALPEATRPFLAFETLTLAPFDRRMIETAALTEAERGWLDAYHARVLREVGAGLRAAEDAPVLAWLGEACAPVAG